MEEIKTQEKQKAFILIIKYRELLLKLKNMMKVLEGYSSLSFLDNLFWTLIADSGEEKMIHSHLKERT